MKKQFQILAATIITVVFASCSKEKIETTGSPLPSDQEILAARGGGGFRPNNDPLVANLQARFEFDADLKEKNGKLHEGAPTSRGATKYGTDRKGVANKALLLDGTYGVKLSGVPQQTIRSVSVWLLVANAYLNYNTYALYGNGFCLHHKHTWNSWLDDNPHYHDFSAGLLLDTESNNNPWMNYEFTTYYYYRQWLHFVITYDGTTAKFYINGTQVGSNSDFPTTISPQLVNYQLGFRTLDESEDFWIGRMDDLRFYSHALSSAEVQKLFTQDEIIDPPFWEQ